MSRRALHCRLQSLLQPGALLVNRRPRALRGRRRLRLGHRLRFRTRNFRRRLGRDRQRSVSSLDGVHVRDRLVPADTKFAGLNDLDRLCQDCDPRPPAIPRVLRVTRQLHVQAISPEDIPCPFRPCYSRPPTCCPRKPTRLGQ